MNETILFDPKKSSRPIGSIKITWFATDAMEVYYFHRI